MSVAVVEHVEQTADGGWRVAGTRVSLDSIVHAYWDGRSPEAIVDEFPTLTAEQVYGALAHYLRHKSEIDHYLEQQAHRWQHVQGRSETQHSALLHRLRAAESQFACPQLALSRNGRLI